MKKAAAIVGAVAAAGAIAASALLKEPEPPCFDPKKGEGAQVSSCQFLGTCPPPKHVPKRCPP